jgi:hypothetical protein
MIGNSEEEDGNYDSKSGNSKKEDAASGDSNEDGSGIRYGNQEVAGSGNIKNEGDNDESINISFEDEKKALNL